MTGVVLVCGGASLTPWSEALASEGIVLREIHTVGALEAALEQGDVIAAVAAEAGVPSFAQVMGLDRSVPVLVSVPEFDVEAALAWMNRGASGLVAPGMGAREIAQQLRDCALRHPPRPIHAASFHGLAGRSPAMRHVFDVITRVAPTRLTVAVYGESGTGKELVARAIHDLSPRAGREFLAINCSALPPHLLQSELFGVRRGSFTGADADRKGLFEQADGGTLFLDEVGDLAPATQVTLLRVLQEGEILPIGAPKPIPVDVRVVVATHRDLEAAVRQGTFREDLFFRINVASVRLPPLRDRGDDVVLLALAFVESLALRHGRTGIELDQDARAALLEHPWPGNVRELRHAVERAVVMARGSTISRADLIPTVAGARAAPGVLPLREARDRWEREYLEGLMRIARGNVSQAARLAGKHRPDLYGLLRKHGLEPADFKTKDED